MLRTFSWRSAANGLVLVSAIACSDEQSSKPAIESGTSGSAGASALPGAGGSANAGRGGALNSGEAGQAAGGGGGCTEGLLLCEPLSAFPERISETGVFPEAPDFSKRSPRVHLFAPSTPLWSDGLRKARYVVVPNGEKIDNSDRDRWQFPVGTLFIKTFFDDGEGSVDHPVETRFIRKAADEYQYAVYIWNEAGTEAQLADNENDKRVPVSATLSERGSFTHNVPSTYDCEECHRENSRTTGSNVIGFDEVRLNSKLSDDATRTQLEEFAALGFFSDPLPSAPKTIADDDARLERVKRFVFGNCVHCHNGARIESFAPDVFVENTVNKAPDASGIEVPDGYLRIVPGDPSRSVVFLQTRRTGLPDGFKPMPPIGVQFAPEDELDNLRLWIESLN